jgi:hypothetical protein
MTDEPASTARIPAATVKRCLHCGASFGPGRKGLKVFALRKYCCHACSCEARISSMRVRWEKKVQRAANGCLIWTGSKNARGYGNIRNLVTRSRLCAHRAAYEIFIGPIPEGMQVLHRCDNPSCVEPTHLFLGSQVTNMRDMLSKGRSFKAKLVPDQVREIRERLLRGDAGVLLAREFGVTPTAISFIKRGRSWRWAQ